MEKVIHNCMFLNAHGDLNISWDSQDQTAMEEVILKKLDEGYTFFVVKKKFFGLYKSKEKLNKSNLKSNINNREIIVKDKDLDIFIKQSKSAGINSVSESEYEVEGSLSKKSVREKTSWGKEQSLVAIKPAVAG